MFPTLTIEYEASPQKVSASGVTESLSGVENPGRESVILFRNRESLWCVALATT